MTKDSLGPIESVKFYALFRFSMCSDSIEKMKFDLEDSK